MQWCLTTCPDSRAWSRGRIMMCSRGLLSKLVGIFFCPCCVLLVWAVYPCMRLTAQLAHSFLDFLLFTLHTTSHPLIENLSHWLVGRQACSLSHAKRSPTASPHVYRGGDIIKSLMTRSNPEGEKNISFFDGVFLDMVQLVLVRKAPPLRIAPSSLDKFPPIQCLSRIVRLAITSSELPVIVSSNKPLQSWMSTTRLYVHVPRRQIRSGICKPERFREVEISIFIRWLADWAMRLSSEDID